MKHLNVTKIGKAKVIVDIVRKGNPKIRPQHKMKPRDVVIHNTGNPSRGANAEMHNRYIHNMAGYEPKDTAHVSWHLSVDDKFIYQHIPFDESAWHTGDGSSKDSGNRNGIGIEICENPDMNYKQAEENAIALAVHLMKTFNIGIANVRPHQFYSGKYCPRVILNRDKTFTPYRNRIESAFKGGKTSSSGSNPSIVQTDSKQMKVGSKVTLSNSATKYATGQNIPKSVKGKQYTIQQVTADRVLLKEIYSWVYAKDVGGKAVSKPSKPAPSNPTPKPKAIKVGQKVTLSKSAKKYATGQNIPASIKGKKYTVQQINGNRVLLKEIYSWVHKADVSGGTTSVSKSTTSNKIKTVGQIKVDKLKNFTYIYDKPNAKSKQLGTAKKNSTFNIAGSVPNWYEVIYKGRRAYISSKYASRR